MSDFGIARNFNDISGLTKTNMTVGTVAYSAPEQLLGEDIDGRADQYSLAATAYHLLTGSQLFPNSNPAVVISRHLNVPPPALADSRPDLAKLDPALAIGLAKRPEDRFKRCSDFARALSEQIDSAGAPTTSAPTASAPRATPAVDAAAGPSRRRTLSVAVFVAIFLFASIGVVVFLLRPSQHDRAANSTTSTAASAVPFPSFSTTPEEPTTSAPQPQAPQTPTARPTTTIAPSIPSAGRIYNAPGGFSFVIPADWVEADASHLDYGTALLSKQTGPAPPGQPPPVANDTRVVLGRLDKTLYASAEANNAKAAVRLGSDMGEFFMPYPGMRVNQETTPLTGANGITGSASYYEVKFSDPSKHNGQIWTGVVGAPATSTPNAGPPQRWWVVWLGTANDPVDEAAAKMLAESLRPWTPPNGSR